jgi:hypothetical protein
MRLTLQCRVLQMRSENIDFSGAYLGTAQMKVTTNPERETRVNTVLTTVRNVFIATTIDTSAGVQAILPNEKEYEKKFGKKFYAMKASYDLSIVFDTRASMSLSPRRSDFIGRPNQPETEAMYGLKGKIKVVGTGIVSWTVYDVNGVIRTIKTKAHYIPDANTRLFSPQVYFQEQRGGEARIKSDSIEFVLKEGTIMKLQYNVGSNIPFMLIKEPLTVGLTHTDVEHLTQQHVVVANISVADEVNQNITDSQKELLITHWKTGYANFDWIQALGTNPRADERQDLPFFKFKQPKTTSCRKPICVACQMGKQTHRTPEKPINHRHEKHEMILRQGHLQPGIMVSIDQYISAIPGRLEHTRGNEAKKEQYVGGIIFCDHASKLIWVKHQVSLRAGDTIQAKRFFESKAASCGVNIKGYHADNVPFDLN